MHWPTLMGLTSDAIAISLQEQTAALCSAGLGWLQLRDKSRSDQELEPIAFECLVRCREVGCTFVINDRLSLVKKIGADGVHLGRHDSPWEEARDFLGSGFLIGGTVNSIADAKRAVSCGVLDYVGVGPYRFTRTKKNLATVLSPKEWQTIIDTLGNLPVYAIGGIGLEDCKTLASWKITGIAVCSALYQGLDIGHNYHQFIKEYEEQNPENCR